MFVKRRRFIVVGLVIGAVLYSYFKSSPVNVASTRSNYPSPSASSAAFGVSTNTYNKSNVLLVQSIGRLADRVRIYNVFLNTLRSRTFAADLTRQWTFIPKKVDVLWAKDDDYMDRLSNYSHVYTVALPWLEITNKSSSTWNSLEDSSNLLIQKYYEWTADDLLCGWIETPGATHMNYNAVYNRTCNRNISHTSKPRSLAPTFLNGKPVWPGHYWPNNGKSYPTHFYTQPPPYVFYLHIHRNAIVTSVGDVYSHNLKLVLFACSYDTSSVIPHVGNFNAIPLYEELFVITQFWGRGVFHRMAEIVPRIVIYLDFLMTNPNIFILAPEAAGGRLAEIVAILGINESRLVTGLARAKLVYQPRASQCGFTNVPEGQVLSSFYRDYIRHHFPSAQPRNKLILIRRSGSRKFAQQQAIEQVLQEVSKEYNLTFVIYNDNPSPSLNETMILFNSAVAVVAPHGAGLSNLFFSEPGTYVIEGICNVPHVNLCYLRLAHILGHHWHGIPSRRGCTGVVDVAATSIQLALKQYLRLWAPNRI